MSLQFLHPLFLFGLAAAVLPILIHRLTRRRAITRRFSAVRLLIKSQQVMARPHRLRHLLLLALRVLGVMGLAFLMARPLLIRQGFLPLRGETEKIVILDNSFSMGYRADNGRRYDIAQKAAKEVIGGLKGRVAILPTSSFNKEVHWMSTEEALREVDRIPLSFKRGEPMNALSLGYRLLNEIKKPGEVLIISDMARGDWEGFDLSRLGILSSEPRMNFLRIGGPNRDSNLAIRELSLTEGEAVVGIPARMEVRVSNLSDQPGEILVQLYLSGVKKDQKSVAIKAGEEGKAYFELFLDRPGWVDGEVRISEDRLPLDDVFYFSMRVREKIKVLIVDGDPRTSLKASESYYLVNALHPGGSGSSPFLSKVITEGEFADVDTKPYEAFFLLNMVRPQPSKLHSLFESGKPVFLFLGDRVIPEEYNGLPLFPWRIRETKETDSLGIIEIDHRRPILKSLSRTGGDSLRGASFRRYFKIEGSTKNLLTLKNRDPLLVETEMGKGKLFLFASSADLDWNDLPMKAAYLPLVQGLLKEAVGLTHESFPKGLRFGESFEGRMLPTQVTGPEGRPGTYKISLPSGEIRQSINPPIEESDLGKMSQEEIKKKLGKVDGEVMEYGEGLLNVAGAGRKELWPILLAFVLGVLAVEMVVASRI